jgi:uncharacterized DUF497 family protein
MELIYDDDKNQANIDKHSINFEQVANFNFKSALTKIDERNDYGEIRYVSCGLIANRLFILCFVIRHEKYRIISLRKANKREVKTYENTNK